MNASCFISAGPDPSRPACGKAKARRKQKKLDKLIKNGLPAVLTRRQNVSKTVEDFLNSSTCETAKHTLVVRLIQSSPPSEEFSESFDESFAVYKKYQKEIHKDKDHKLTEQSYRRFLCDSPLDPVESNVTGHPGFGSFHQQYVLDGKIIAVGVLDLLPACVSAKYFYYDPQYSFMCLGIYSAIREITLVRQLAALEPRQKYYYMGFYIHSCQKMRYKSCYRPSDLLCPETYTWHPVEKCLPILDRVAYSRFEEDKTKKDEEGEPNLDEVLLLHSNTLMPFGVYKRLKRENALLEQEEVKEYASYVGKTCAYSMCLYRS